MNDSALLSLMDGLFERSGDYAKHTRKILAAQDRLQQLVDIMKGHRVLKSYDHFHPLFNRQRPLMGCLDFLVAEGFFTGDELNDALIFLQDGSPEPENMRVANIVLEFKEAAD